LGFFGKEVESLEGLEVNQKVYLEGEVVEERFLFGNSRLIWIPGNNPVNVPKKIPTNKATNISTNNFQNLHLFIPLKLTNYTNNLNIPTLKTPRTFTN